MKLIAYALTALFVSGIELTPENWDEKTAGRTIFIRLFTHSCEYCMEVEPSWLRLMKTFENRDTVLIADVDCEGQGKDLCSKMGVVDDYPTLKWGNPKNPENLERYHESFQYDDLLTFAGKNIAPICGPKHMDLCDADETAKIKAMQALGTDILEAKIFEIQKSINMVEHTFEKKYEQLYEEYEKEYTQVRQERVRAIELLKGEDFGLKKIVLAQLQTHGRHDEL